MMESSNLDHHHQQELVHGGSSSLTSPRFPLVGGDLVWNQNLTVNNSGFTPNVSGVLSSSKDFRPSNVIPVPPHMVQDLGFRWVGTAESYMNHSVHPVNLARTKEELSPSFPKLSDIISHPSTIEDYHLSSTSCIKSEQQGLHKLDEWLANFGSSTACGRGNYSMVLPTTNISSLNPSSAPYLTSLGMDLQALDLLASARFGRSLCEPSFESMALFRDDLAFGLGHLQEPAQGTPNNHQKIQSLIGAPTEAKRGNGGLENKASQIVTKKPRFETHSSCSPFKVRKEKLGDRIAALQQLVAPFGKTDTTSVLMEAIGYIKFLQDQVETLSVPYMRSSNKKLRATQGASSEDGEEPKSDLRSRGLCLVPLSCTSYVTNENGGVWSP